MVICAWPSLPWNSRQSFYTGLESDNHSYIFWHFSLLCTFDTSKLSCGYGWQAQNEDRVSALTIRSNINYFTFRLTSFGTSVPFARPHPLQWLHLARLDSIWRLWRLIYLSSPRSLRSHHHNLLLPHIDWWAQCWPRSRLGFATAARRNRHWMQMVLEQWFPDIIVIVIRYVTF